MDTSKLSKKKEILVIKNKEKSTAKKMTKKTKIKKNTSQKASFYKVTKRQFKTRKKTYKLSKIEKTEIRRNLIFFFPISILSLLFTYKFWNYLYTDEVIFIISVSLVMGFLSLFLGTLYVYSKALGEPALFNFISVLRKIRNEMDDVMFDLEDEKERLRDEEIDD